MFWIKLLPEFVLKLLDGPVEACKIFIVVSEAEFVENVPPPFSPEVPAIVIVESFTVADAAAPEVIPVIWPNVSKVIDWTKFWPVLDALAAAHVSHTL